MALFEKPDIAWESIAANKRRTSSSVNTYGGLVADTDLSCRGRGPGIPAGRPGVLGQLAQRQLVTPDGGGPQVAAVKEPVDRFLGD